MFNLAPRHEGVWGSGNIAPRILNLGPRCMWSTSRSCRLTPNAESSRHALDKEVGWTQSQYGQRDKNIPCPSRESTTGLQACSQLLYHWAIPVHV